MKNKSIRVRLKNELRTTSKLLTEYMLLLTLLRWKKPTTRGVRIYEL